MNPTERDKKPLSKMQYLQTLNVNVIGCDELDRRYNNYVLDFYGYEHHEQHYTFYLS